MKRAVVVVFAVLLAMSAGRSVAETTGVHTAEPESLFAAANAAYEAGAYADAIEMYSGVAQLGIVNSDLYYNLANAYFKSGDLGRSVLWYERSLRIEPRDDDARANLAMVRSLLRDQQLIPPRGGVRNAALAWHRGLSTGESVAVASAFYGLFCLAGLCLIFRRTPIVSGVYRVVSWVSPARLFGLTMTQDMVLAMVTTAVIALVFAGSAYTKAQDTRAAQRGVVVSEEVTVFSGPSDESTIQFRIHEGTIVSVRDGRSGWVRVDLPGDLSGWVEERTVERI
jgi:tetratricopeptide (TPR) repeat protein